MKLPPSEEADSIRFEAASELASVYEKEVCIHCTYISFQKQLVTSQMILRCFCVYLSTFMMAWSHKVLLSENDNFWNLWGHIYLMNMILLTYSIITTKGYFPTMLIHIRSFSGWLESVFVLFNTMPCNTFFFLYVTLYKCYKMYVFSNKVYILVLSVGCTCLILSTMTSNMRMILWTLNYYYAIQRLIHTLYISVSLWRS